MTRPVPPLAELNLDRTQRLLGQRLAGVSGVGQVPVFPRFGTVVAPLISVSSYNVQLSGDGVTRTIPSVAAYPPLVGDLVRVAQIDGSYVIQSVVGGRVMQSGRVSVVITAANTGATAVTFPVPYNAAPDVQLAVQTAANIGVRISTGSTTAGFTVTAFVTAGGTTTVTVTVHWFAFGV